MAVYVIFKKYDDPLGGPANEVYYRQGLEDAVTFLDYKNASGDTKWAMAEVFDMNTWLGKLIRWAIVKK